MFYEVFEEEEHKLKSRLPAGMNAGFTAETIQAAPSAALPPSPFISIRTQSIIPVSWAEHLSGILTRSTGYDHLWDYRSRCGRTIPCGYLPLYCARSVAEQAVLLMMSLLRRLKKQAAQFETFNRDGLTGGECLGRCLLVIGVGHIGQEVVKLGRGLGLRVLGVDLVKRMDDLEYVGLEEGIQRADVIVSALPLTELTRGMLNCRCLALAKQGVLFVNVGRGEVAPVKDLQRLLDDGKLGGLALDVYEEEGDFAEYLRSGKGNLSESGKILMALRDREQVLLTPHNAFNTSEAVERKAAQTCESVVRFLRDGIFPYPLPEKS